MQLRRTFPARDMAKFVTIFLVFQSGALLASAKAPRCSTMHLESPLQIGKSPLYKLEAALFQLENELAATQTWARSLGQPLPSTVKQMEKFRGFFRNEKNSSADELMLDSALASDPFLKGKAVEFKESLKHNLRNPELKALSSEQILLIETIHSLPDRGGRKADLVIAGFKGLLAMKSFVEKLSSPAALHQFADIANARLEVQEWLFDLRTVHGHRVSQSNFESIRHLVYEAEQNEKKEAKKNKKGLTRDLFYPFGVTLSRQQRAVVVHQLTKDTDPHRIDQIYKAFTAVRAGNLVPYEVFLNLAFGRAHSRSMDDWERLQILDAAEKGGSRAIAISQGVNTNFGF